SPLYLQIKHYIQGGIMEGEFRENDRIPTENELMEKFNVSRITAKNALNSLSQEGWIKRIRGRGSFVNENVDSLVQQERESASVALSAIGPSRTLNAKRKIGLIIPGIDDYFAIGIIWGVRK